MSDFNTNTNNVTIEVVTTPGTTVEFDLTLSALNTSTASPATGLNYTVTDVANSDSANTANFDLVGANGVTADDVDVTVGETNAYVNVSHVPDTPSEVQIALYDESDSLVLQDDTAANTGSVTNVDTSVGGYTNFTVNLTASAGTAFELGDYTVYAAANGSSNFGAVTDTNNQVETTFSIGGLEVTDFTGADGTPIRVAANGTSLEYTVTVENTGSSEVTQNVSLLASDNGTTDISNDFTLGGDPATEATEEVTVGAGNTTEVDLTINTGDLHQASDNVADYVIAGYTEGSPYSLQTSSLKVGSSTSGSLTFSVVDGNANQQEGIYVELWLQSDYDDSSLVIRNQSTNENGQVTFTGLAVGSDNNNQIVYTARAGGANPNFDSTTTSLALYETTQTSDSSTMTIQRIVDADRLTIDDYDPSSTVDVGSTVAISTLVETEDSPPVGTFSGMEDATVEVTNIASSGLASISGISIGDTVDTDSNGIAEFTGITTTEAFDELDQDTTFNITFQASPSGSTSASEVTAYAEITFQAEPPSGTGEIAGDIEEYDEDITLVGSQSQNAEAADGVSVHAVTDDRLSSNTDTVTVPANNDTYTRVINDTTGEVLNVQTDYLLTSSDVTISSNTSLPGTGFNVETDASGGSYDVSVLEPGDYTVQFSDNGSFVAPTNLTTFTADNDLTFDGTADRYSSVPAQHTDVTGADGQFTLLNLYTNGSSGVDYTVIAAEDNGSLGFANGHGYNDVTVQQGVTDGPQYEVSLSVQQVDVDADSVNITNLGTLSSAADADADYESALDEFSDTSDDVRQDIPRDSSTVDVIDVRTFLSEDDTDIGAEVTISYTATAGTFNGAFLNASVGGDVIAHSDDEITIDTNDGNAVVFLEADSAGLGTDANVTVSADANSPATGTDSTDKVFTGVLDQTYKSASITGVVTDANDNPVDAQIYVSEMTDSQSGISITFEPDSTTDLEDFTATVYDDPTPANGDVIETVDLTASQMQSFEFQGFDSNLSLASGQESFELLADRSADRTTLSPVPALDGTPLVTHALTGASETGQTGTSVSTSVEVNRTSTASVVIEDVAAATFDVSNLDPSEATITSGDSLTVTADVENVGDFDDEQDVTLSIDGDEYDSETLSLVAGASDSVELTADNVDLDAGNYTYTVSSEDTSVEGELTVESTNTNTTDWWDSYVDSNGVATVSGIQDAIDDWSAGSLDIGDVNTLIDSWQAGNPVEDLV